jgi:PAS domain S-box-containing protein
MPRSPVVVNNDPVPRRSSDSLRPNRPMPWDALTRALWRSPVGIGIVGPDLRYASVNEALARMNGVSAAAHVGRTAQEVLPFATPITAAQRRVLETGAAVQGVRVVHPGLAGGPETRTIRTFLPLRGPSGDPAGVATIAVRTEDEAALAERLVDSAPEGIAFLDPSLRYLLANPALAALNGPPREAHLGRRLRDVIPKVAGWAEPVLDAVLETGRAVTGVAFDVERPPGSGRWSSWVSSFFPVRAAGRILGVGSVVTDITGLREREAGLVRSRGEAQTAAEQARREVEHLDDVVHALSHDLRTPLAAILGYGQLLEAHPERIDIVRRAATALVRTAARLELMIADLAEMVRLEGGRTRAQLEPVSLPELTRDLIERLGPALGFDRLRLDVPDDLPPVRADAARIERVVVNLVSNALKYSPAGTPIELRARLAEHGTVEISVTDQGRGIAADEQGRLFERFYRARGSEKREGLGLGLYLARLLAESMGGSISVRSTVGEGSTFTLRLRAVE